MWKLLIHISGCSETIKMKAIRERLMRVDSGRLAKPYIELVPMSEFGQLRTYAEHLAMDI